jgi:hypothetical protein
LPLCARLIIRIRPVCRHGYPPSARRVALRSRREGLNDRAGDDAAKTGQQENQVDSIDHQHCREMNPLISSGRRKILRALIADIGLEAQIALPEVARLPIGVKTL